MNSGSRLLKLGEPSVEVGAGRKLQIIVRVESVRVDKVFVRVGISLVCLPSRGSFIDLYDVFLFSHVAFSATKMLGLNKKPSYLEQMSHFVLEKVYHLLMFKMVPWCFILRIWDQNIIGEHTHTHIYIYMIRKHLLITLISNELICLQTVTWFQLGLIWFGWV